MAASTPSPGSRLFRSISLYDLRGRNRNTPPPAQTSPSPNAQSGSPNARSSQGTFGSIAQRQFAQDRAEYALAFLAMNSWRAPFFAGNKDRSVLLFFSELEDLFDTFNIAVADHRIRISLATRLMAEAPRREVEGWQGRESENYPAFAEKCKSMYLNQIGDDIPDALGDRLRLYQVRQRRSLHQYVVEFENLLRRIRSQPSQEIQATLFFCGLEPSLRNRVALLLRRTLSEKPTERRGFTLKSLFLPNRKLAEEAFPWSYEQIKVTANTLFSTIPEPPAVHAQSPSDHPSGSGAVITPFLPIHMLHEIRYHNLPKDLFNGLSKDRTKKGAETSDKPTPPLSQLTPEPTPTPDELASLIQLSVIAEEEEENGGWTRSSTPTSSTTDVNGQLVEAETNPRTQSMTYVSEEWVSLRGQ